MANFYSGLAVCILFLHALFILFFGALLTRSRPALRWLHIISLVWGIFTELLPWPCPLTLLENWLEAKAGVEAYQGGFLLHYLDKFVYPDISATALMVALSILDSMDVECGSPSAAKFHWLTALSCLPKLNQNPLSIRP